MSVVHNRLNFFATLLPRILPFVIENSALLF